MDLKCKHDKCDNVYRMEISGSGKGFIWQIIVSWECSVCGFINVYVKDELKGIEYQKEGI